MIVPFPGLVLALLQELVFVFHFDLTCNPLPGAVRLLPLRLDRAPLLQDVLRAFLRVFIRHLDFIIRIFFLMCRIPPLLDANDV